MMLAGITSGSRCYVVADTFKNIKIQTCSEIEWPYQCKASQAHCTTWEVAVKLTFNLQINNSLPAEFQLGEWLDNSTTTGWRYSPSGDRLCQKRRKGGRLNIL
eukprot:12147822-Ditylum_brightwellii.AAC.1